MGTLLNSARSGDRRRLYVSLRNDMARRLEGTDSARDYAAISKSLIAVVDRISDIEERRARPARPAARDGGGGLAEARSKFRVA